MKKCQPRKKTSVSYRRFLQTLIYSIFSFVQRENIFWLLYIIIIITLVSSILLFWVEPDISFPDSLWWSVVTLATIGYGDVTPVTLMGRLIAIVDMFFGIGAVTILTAKIASALIEYKNRENLGMNTYHHQNHLILCEWNYRAKDILNELRYAPETKQLPVVLIADIDRKPVDDDYLYFVRGQVTEDTLMQANLAEASTVIILGDDTIDYSNRDARVVLSTLTVESINPDVYTVVELVNEAYVPTCRRANADEIIVGSEISSRLILSAALNHGISFVITEWLCYNKQGSHLSKTKVPKEKVGQSFLETLVYMKDHYQSIVVGVQQGEEGEVLSNPDKNYQLQKNDYLILIKPVE